MEIVAQWQLRARLASSLSSLYGREVPAYRTLVQVAEAVNHRVLGRDGSAAERLGSMERVTAERHGAIRVGTPRELSQVARIFAAVGMYPTGFYDLRDAAPNPIPVVSTAFRPLRREELARNPFRMFTSLLITDDRRFFDAETQQRLDDFLSRREIFAPELLRLADRSIAGDGLNAADADRFVALATATFALSDEPVDRAWYAHLERISGVAADIGGVDSTHLNHLTPRVLDIDDLYASMQAAGITMIEEIQGPPAWPGPDVLLRQTSFRALAEPRRFREADGRQVDGELRVRFGEVEARGVALTPTGRRRYDAMLGEVARRVAETHASRAEVAAAVWHEQLPDTDAELAAQGLAYYTAALSPSPPAGEPPSDLATLVRQGWLDLEPVVYEDFLPQSAAGIFASNLTGAGELDASGAGSPRDEGWLAEVVGGTLHDPHDGYAAQRDAALDRVARELNLPAITLPDGA
ncbi:2-oxoadipate dioxygenase/decarboxylase [Enemella dayhoffiae]|uniref:2-oxoadipate dioxygenase/decarboxylase n=1 Tax=Enemella dayhoffiae TaxID=2016507 RepID=UPI001E462445|nr:VOC family protein [Enemella dayhoffiae]